MPRKRRFSDDDFNPDKERFKRRKMYNARRSKSSRQIDNKRQNSKRSKAERQTENKNRSKADRQADNKKQHQKRSKADRQADNKKQNPKRKLKTDMSGMAYDTSSPFPPTVEQLNFTGQILDNAIAGLFAQQAPSPEISFANVVAEQLRIYTEPIIDFTMYQFRQECCCTLLGDINFGKAAANKALNTLDKILIINDHYELMWDINIWDIFHPPSIAELKQLSARHPYQPISDVLRKEVDNCKKQIYARMDSIIEYRQNNSSYMESARFDNVASAPNEESS